MLLLRGSRRASLPEEAGEITFSEVTFSKITFSIALGLFMHCWDYWIEELDLNKAADKDKLADLGENGWELTATWPLAKKPDAQRRFVFKREPSYRFDDLKTASSERTEQPEG
jgi:hypothetical protein